MTKPGRNEPCHCGSGRKYKQCCAEKDGTVGTKGPIIAAVAIVTVGALAAAVSLSDRARSPETAALTPITSPANGAKLPSNPPPETKSPIEVSGSIPFTQTPPVANIKVGKPAPAGAAPAGKVWSPEHGHWHDAPRTVHAGELPPTTSTSVMNIAAPAGAAPPGKVWSREHGHWHDEPGAARPTVTIPANLTPSTKVWSKQHNHWHNAPGAPAAANAPLAKAPPATRKVWSKEHNHWHNEPAN